MADTSVFGKIKTVQDYQQLQQAFDMKRQLAGAQIMQVQNKAQQAQYLDITKFGTQALYKAAQGLPLTPEEDAAARVVNAKSGGFFPDPVTGSMMEKPDIAGKLGLRLGEQSEIPQVPPISTVLPTQTPQSMPVGDAFKANMTGQKEAPSDFMDTVAPVSAPMSGPNAGREQAHKAALERAQGNPKLQQTIKADYEKANMDSPQKTFDNANQLRDEVNTLTKDYRTVQDAYNKVQTVDDTGAGDISLIFGVQKLNDPGSVVREQEFIQAASVGAYGEKLKAQIGRLLSGDRLTPAQRTELKSQAQRTFEAQKMGYDQAVGGYKSIAERNGMNPNDVIVDFTTPKQNLQKSFEEKQGYKTTPKSKIKYRIVQ